MGIYNDELTVFSTHQLDSFIRLIYQNTNYFYEDYMERKQGVFFESLYINHISKCSKNDAQNLCFCSQFTQDSHSPNVKDILGQDFRKQFMINQIINLYKNYLNKADFFQKKNILFSYLSFLIEQTRNLKNIAIEDLRVIQNQLYALNSKDSVLINLSQIFQICLDFYNTSNLNVKSKKKLRQTLNFDLEDVFSPQYCSIYFSLISQFVEIKRTSTNFQQIFQIDQASVLGKQISELLPKILHEVHELTISEYINLGNKDSLISTDQRFAFALNGKGFIFPISIRIKTEKFLDDFGVTALIKKGSDLKIVKGSATFQLYSLNSCNYE
ncbi:hypothetical protein TTHERM_00627290 (macronuclear) [Tetrahymena thermophila SB210]|uniref:Uncharacterized protein n=1 Tax=Tetrahymena thermophila (strain SB210) TaxID=312017 RepID=Q23RX0_TETTS|nr:hypothetical protein TTHERM_00627290 [Tetrahymena thermophila SB210]EAR99269.2 hypothetical protein TTHERM_00627290 [Tetrahymena thermophila SB210]|eukprot:XP_001019514.2 hypothetical protein TTHERM_00627290 [Tetrahymena thermophila SB210]